MVLSVNKTRCGDEESEKGDEILSTDRRAAVAPSRQLRRARAFEEIENCLKIQNLEINCFKSMWLSTFKHLTTFNT